MNQGTPARSPDTLDKDRFSLLQLYAWMAFGALMYFSDQLDRSLRLSYLLVPLLLIPAAIVVIIWLVGFSKSLWNRQ
jgi:Na+/H+ antiporter NhaC